MDLGRQTEAQNVVGAQWSQDLTEGYSGCVIRVDRREGRKGIWIPSGGHLEMPFLCASQVDFSLFACFSLSQKKPNNKWKFKPRYWLK